MYVPLPGARCAHTWHSDTVACFCFNSHMASPQPACTSASAAFLAVLTARADSSSCTHSMRGRGDVRAGQQHR